MIAARLELHAFSRSNLDALLHRAHLHYAVLHLHFVNLKPAGDLVRAANQAVGRGALILDHDVAAGDVCTLWRCARPRVNNADRTNIVIVSKRYRREHAKGSAHDDAFQTHLFLHELLSATRSASSN